MGLIEPHEIPRFRGDFDVIRQQAGQLVTVGASTVRTGSVVATKYAALRGVYAAPEQEWLFSSIEPVKRDTADFGGNLKKLGNFLLGFADQLEPVAEALTEVQNEVYGFHSRINRYRFNGRRIADAYVEAKRKAGSIGFVGEVVDILDREVFTPAGEMMITGGARHEARQYRRADFPGIDMDGDGAIMSGSDWDNYSDLIRDNNEFSARVRRLVEELSGIQLRYANKIAGLYGGRKWDTATGEPDGWTIPMTPEERFWDRHGIELVDVPSWAVDAEWDRPAGVDIVLAPGELALEGLDTLTTLSGTQAAARAQLEAMGLGDTDFAKSLADWKETGEAWASLGKTALMVVGELSSVVPITDTGFKSLVGEENAEDLHRFGVQWANTMVEEWDKNPSKILISVAAGFVPVGGGLTAIRGVAMASRIRPIANVARGVQKVIDIKDVTVARTLDVIKLPKVADVITGRTKIPVISDKLDLPSGDARVAFDGRGEPVLPDRREPVVPSRREPVTSDPEQVVQGRAEPSVGRSGEPVRTRSESGTSDQADSGGSTSTHPEPEVRRVKSDESVGRQLEDRRHDEKTDPPRNEDGQERGHHGDAGQVKRKGDQRAFPDRDISRVLDPDSRTTERTRPDPQPSDIARRLDPDGKTDHREPDSVLEPTSDTSHRSDQVTLSHGDNRPSEITRRLEDIPSDLKEVPPARTIADGREQPATPRLNRYEGEQYGRSTGLPAGHKVKYLDERRRERYRVVVKDGRLYTSDGKPFDTSSGKTAWTGERRAIFVMDRHGNVFASLEHEVGVFHHTSFLAGEPVAAAGEIKVVHGRVVMVNNQSGHYRPARRYLDQMIAHLAENGVDIDAVSVEPVTGS